MLDKADFPFHRVKKAYAIDDEGCDEALQHCHFIALVDKYYGGDDSGFLITAAMKVVERHIDGDIGIRSH